MLSYAKQAYECVVWPQLVEFVLRWCRCIALGPCLPALRAANVESLYLFTVAAAAHYVALAQKITRTDRWVLLHVLCRSAFKSLSYKKYHQVPLYLEWAPKDVWDTPPPTTAAAAAKPKVAAAAAATADAGSSDQVDAAAAPAGKKTSDSAAAAAAAAAAEDDEDDQADRPVGWIYVKNLNFGTTDAALKKHFDKAVSAAGGVIHSAKVSGLGELS